MGSRALCFAAKGVQYGAVGMVMGTTGSGFVLCLTSLRQALDRDYKPPATYQPALGTGVGWGLFMSGSSNVRYNLINFLEDFAQDRWARSPTPSCSFWRSICPCWLSNGEKGVGGSPLHTHPHSLDKAVSWVGWATLLRLLAMLLEYYIRRFPRPSPHPVVNLHTARRESR